MLLQFPTSVDAHVFSIGTLLCQETKNPHPDQTMACQNVSNGFPDDARPLCELDGMVGAHDVGSLLSKNARENGGLCVRATRPFYEPNANPSHNWIAASQVKIVGDTSEKIKQENLFASSFVINARLWERHAPELILNLSKAPFETEKYLEPGLSGCKVVNTAKLEPNQTEDLSLAELPLGVGLILGALASGYPGQFGKESFSSTEEFLASLAYVFKLLPSALRHTVSFSYGFQHRQPICTLQYFDDREIPQGAFTKPVAALPLGATLESTCQEVRGLLAGRLKNIYAPELELSEYDDFEDNDELFEEDSLFEELSGLARETSASLGQVLNEIGINMRVEASSLLPESATDQPRLLALEALLRGDDTTPHIAGLYTLFSDFDSAPHIYEQLLETVKENFKSEIFDLSLSLGCAIRDEKFDSQDLQFLSQMEDLLCLAGRLPTSEPFLEYRSRIIEGAADGSRQYVSNLSYLTPEQLVALSEYEQVSDMVACILETGDWAFTQRLNISFTIFALSGEGYIQDAAALARRLLPPSVVSHQWIHALINSRALAESFEAIILDPSLLPAEQVVTILQSMTDHLARTGRKEIVLEHVTRLGKTLPTQEEANFELESAKEPLSDEMMLRLRMMTILSDAAERFHASAQHARLILSR